MRRVTLVHAVLCAFLAGTSAHRYGVRGRESSEIALPSQLCPGQLAATAGGQKGNFSPVTLIHIPRTGGTSIEDCTQKEPTDVLRWGRFNSVLKGLNKKEFPCNGQHWPPNLAGDFYKGQDTFCVVRNPYQRLVSQYGWASGFFHNSQNNCTKDGMNQYLLKMLTKAKGDSDHKPNGMVTDCHFLPQAAFVYGWDRQDSKVDRSARACQKVLQFERLSEEFNGLMTEKGYPYRLTKPVRTGKKAADDDSVNKNTRSPISCHYLTADDLGAEVRKLTEDLYAEDFELLGFQKM